MTRSILYFFYILYFQYIIIFYIFYCELCVDVDVDTVHKLKSTRVPGYVPQIVFSLLFVWISLSYFNGAMIYI